MIDFSPFFQKAQGTRLKPWCDSLQKLSEEKITHANNGDLPRWLKQLEDLDAIQSSHVDFSDKDIQVGLETDLPDEKRKEFEEKLRKFHPWRKGPFNLFGIHMDTEWRCDMKWERVREATGPLENKAILDVGSGNGYYIWRMMAENPKLVMGIDPTLLYVIQFFIFQKYIRDYRAAVLPLGVDDMPENMEAFDTVFSMGLLYHRRAPFDHLLQLKSYLKEKGRLVLETLVIDGKEGDVLSPAGRYAMMPNVWFLPSPGTLESWLKRMQYKNIQLINVNQTTSEEQRVTDWMGFHSLENFLDPDNPNQTVEGYPAPKRAVFIAEK